MGHERGGESRQEREQRQGKGRPNRREFLAGSVGALAAARINKKFGGLSSLSREGRGDRESAYGGGAAPRDY